MKAKVLLIGGHLTPALALIEHIASTDPEVEQVFVGRLYSQDKTRQPSQEKPEVEQRGVKFIPFATARMSGVWSIVSQLPLLVRSVFTARRILKQEQPSVVVSFGGYLAVPIAFAAWWLGIPIVTHEQTRTVGFATQLIGKWAQIIAVSFPETLAELPANKAVLVGNPLRQELLAVPPEPSWQLSSTLPLLYVTGGNQGSQWINQSIGALLPELLTEWRVIHQSGNATATYDAKTELETLQRQLSPDLQSRYLVKEWFSTAELGWIYRHATAVVSRSGANTIQELQYFAVPSLLIPLPFSRRNEQTLNAQHLVKLGGALMLDQTQSSSADLATALHNLKKQSAEFKKQLQAHPIATDATDRLWNVILKNINSNPSLSHD